MAHIGTVSIDRSWIQCTDTDYFCLFIDNVWIFGVLLASQSQSVCAGQIMQADRLQTEVPPFEALTDAEHRAESSNLCDSFQIFVILGVMARISEPILICTTRLLDVQIIQKAHHFSLSVLFVCVWFIFHCGRMGYTLLWQMCINLDIGCVGYFFVILSWSICWYNSFWQRRCYQCIWNYICMFFFSVAGLILVGYQT